MKKSWTKILTVALAAATLAGTSLATAIPATALSADDKDTIKVIDVSDSSTALTVKAYQVVEFTYDNGSVTGSQLTALADGSGVALADIKSGMDYDNIVKLANNIDVSTATGIQLTKVAGTTTYQAAAPAGVYIIIVTGADATVYNPAIVSIGIDGDSLTTDNKVSMADTAYLKSTTPKFDKNIVGSSEGNTEGDTVAYGSEVEFEIKDMAFPAYSNFYTDPVGAKELRFEISDELDPTAFEGIDEIEVTVGNGAANTEKYTVEYTDKTGAVTTDTGAALGFTVKFADDYIRANPNVPVKITYKSTFTSNATLNYAENKNTATLKYSNNPKNLDAVKTLTDTTYHYSFGIDADIDTRAETGSSTENRETYELNKVTEKRSAAKDYVDGTSKKTGSATMVSQMPLAGAEFKLFTDESCSTVVKIDGKEAVAESDENGHIKFTGLDAATYYMKETKAPTTPYAYALDTRTFKIEIKADLYDKADNVSEELLGVMKSYTITTSEKGEDGNYTEVGKATYTNTPKVLSGGSVDNGVITHKVDQVEIVNTPLPALPSTGGAGTIAITVGAAIGMAGFLTLYIVNKKKKDDEAE